jgi:DNA-binding transcriptional LysR family regulator
VAEQHRDLADAFRARGLPLPKPALTTFSVHLRVSLLTMGPFLTTFPASVLRLNAGRFAVQVLPIDLSGQPWPVAVVTLKNRTLSPVVQLFIDQLRAYTRSLDAGAAAGGPDVVAPTTHRRPGAKSVVRRRSAF